MTRRIDEVSYSELTSLGDTLKKYYGKGLYVHFSRQNKRLGANVKAIHGDPLGVYFYPVDWLLDTEKFHKGDQWGTNFPYYFVCSIDFNKPGLDLNKATPDDFARIGQQNGWLASYQQEMTQAPPTTQHQTAMSAYRYLRAINQRQGEHRVSWAKSLKGLAWLKDSDGIIMPYEPEQVCVMDPRCIRIIESGQQPELNLGQREKWIYWQRHITALFKRLADRHHGQVAWKHKKPKLVIEGKDWSFKVYFEGDTFSSNGLVIETKIGRAVDQHRITTSKLHDMDTADIERQLEDYLRPCQTFNGNDLFFRPHLAEAETEAWIRDQFFNEIGDIKWEISNSTHMMWGTTNQVAGMPPVATEIKVGTDDDSSWMRLELKVNGQWICSISQCELKDFEDRFWKSFDQLSGAKEEFEEEGVWEEFLGWLGHYSGLKVLEPYEEKFLNTRKKSELYGQIQSSFRRVGW